MWRVALKRAKERRRELGGTGSFGGSREESSGAQIALERVEMGAQRGRQLWRKPRREPGGTGGSGGN